MLSPSCREGSVCFIPNTQDFFIALGKHPGWGDTMSVFAQVEDLVSTDLIAVQYYHNYTDPEHGAPCHCRAGCRWERPRGVHPQSAVLDDER